MSGTWQTSRSGKSVNPFLVAAMAGYDPETLVLLRTALDEAWALLPDKRKSEILKSEMARRILRRAAEGVRDPARLRASALVGGLGGSTPLSPPSPVPQAQQARKRGRASQGGWLLAAKWSAKRKMSGRD
jgi:hypothetical protein